MWLRSLLAFMLGLAAVLLAAGALPAAWLHQNVFDEEGFVSFSAPMVEDSGFRSALAVAVASEASGQLDVPPAVRALARPAIERVVGRLTELDGFEQAWRESAAASHRLSLADPEHPKLAVQLAPLAQLAVREVADRLGVQAPAVGDLPVRFDSGRLEGYAAAAARLAAAWPWLAAGAVAAAVAALLLARRKATAVFWLGLGTAVAGLALWLAAGQLPGLAGGISAGALAEEFAVRFAQLATAGFQPWAAALVAGGGVAALAGLVARLAGQRSGPTGVSRKNASR
ncbi:hypothetical protein LVY72_07465 [Arthrobacter sp. I2-34]|uniref:DUF1461 domain-containing protein n=1 Tax=Arthrobacter hankyongi TaxID=2904801 RepID=A0ABS9L546_9MICC|nr:hypothetical protein [Arthrobacter hankyongi]MCG2621755.1 hypothetical protein [Arthrobacter hankyongi]